MSQWQINAMMDMYLEISRKVISLHFSTFWNNLIIEYVLTKGAMNPW